MEKLGFIQGLSTPCAYRHGVRPWLRSVVHGDDFVSVGARADLEWFHSALSKEWSIVVRALLGPPGCPGCVQSAIILHRMVTWHNQGWEWEADARRASGV